MANKNNPSINFSNNNQKENQNKEHPESESEKGETIKREEKEKEKQNKDYWDRITDDPASGYGAEKEADEDSSDQSSQKQ